jgi:hypothetical membrane protein
MTQLTRPDLARDSAAQRHESLVPASRAASGPAGEQPRPADTVAWQSDASRAVPYWAAVTAAISPVVLVAGWLIADSVQPASYSPIRQTMSSLAGQTGTDQWIMTGSLLALGGCQILTGVGLTGIRLPARLLLIITGLCSIGIAASPEPAAGPTPLHLAFAVGCEVTTAVWPAFLAQRGFGRPWLLSGYSCAVVTSIFAVMSGWLLIESLGGGDDLGLAERLTSSLQGAWPLVVALALLGARRVRGQELRRDTDRPAPVRADRAQGLP